MPVSAGKRLRVPFCYTAPTCRSQPLPQMQQDENTGALIVLAPENMQDGVYAEKILLVHLDAKKRELYNTKGKQTIKEGGAGGGLGSPMDVIDCFLEEEEGCKEKGEVKMLCIDSP